MVLVVAIGGWHYVLTGDATGTTIGYCNRVMASYTYFHKNQLNSQVKMLSMPHHGSYTTTMNIATVARIKGEKTQDLAIRNMNEFAEH